MVDEMNYDALVRLQSAITSAIAEIESGLKLYTREFVERDGTGYFKAKAQEQIKAVEQLRRFNTAINAELWVKAKEQTDGAL